VAPTKGGKGGIRSLLYTSTATLSAAAAATTQQRPYRVIARVTHKHTGRGL